MRLSRTYHDIEATEGLDGLVNHVLNAILLADIRLDGNGLDIRKSLGNEFVSLLHGLAIDVNERDVRTLLCKENGGFEANPAIIQIVSYVSCSVTVSMPTIPRQ